MKRGTPESKAAALIRLEDAQRDLRFAVDRLDEARQSLAHVIGAADLYEQTFKAMSKVEEVYARAILREASRECLDLDEMALEEINGAKGDT